MVPIIQPDSSGGQRANIDLIYSPHSKSPSSVSSSSGSIPLTPRLEIDKLDTSPFSECFSAWFDDDESSPNGRIVADPDFSYDIEHITNMKDINPHWDSQIDEVMVLSKKHKTRPPRVAEESERSHGQKKMTCVSDFQLLHKLHSGHRDEVTLCRKRDTNRLYALRSMRLTLESEPRSEQDLLKIVHRLGSPFLPKLHWTFADSERMYFVKDFYPGGNLLTHLKHSTTFHPDRAHFYACEIIEALVALHSAGIVHRDLKPDNIVVNAKGHVVLTGFDYAKVLGIGSGAHIQRTTLSTTTEYQAPEMHLGWVHDFAVDCWAFGILLHVMLFGRHPFMDHDGSLNQTILRTKVVHGLTHPQPLQPLGTAVRDLIEKCLERNPVVRLDVRGIKAHRYFIGVDWLNITSKTATVPWVPELDEDRVDLRYVGTPEATVQDISVCPTSKYFNEPALASPMVSQTQNDVGSTVALPSTDEEQVIVSSRPMALTRAPRSPAGAIFRIRRHSSGLDVVMEAEEGLNEPQNTMDLTNGTSLKDRLEEQLREQVAKNRASFWDTLSDEQSVSSGHSLDLRDAVGLSPRPHKLRKQKSSALGVLMGSNVSVSDISLKAQIKNKLKKRVQIVSSPVIVAPQVSPRLDLPTGIIQTGKGIGFTYSLGSATLSKASICSTTPRSCHGLFLKTFPRLTGKGKQRGSQRSVGPISSEADDQEMVAVMKEIYGSTWSLGMSAVNLSQPLAYTTTSSPLSSTFSPILLTPEFAEADEAVAGDPDSTLRLVSPSSVPLCR